MSAVDKKLIAQSVEYLKKRPWIESHEFIEKFTDPEFLVSRKMSQDEILQLLDIVGTDIGVQIFLRFQRMYQERDAAEKSLAKKAPTPPNTASVEDEHEPEDNIS